MAHMLCREHLYSIIIATYPQDPGEVTFSIGQTAAPGEDWRLGEIEVDWTDFTREKSSDTSQMQHVPAQGSSSRSLNGVLPTAVGRKKGAPKPDRGIPGSAPLPALRDLESTVDISGSKRKLKADDLSLQPLLAHFPGPNPLESSVASGVTQVGRGVVHLFRHPPPASLIASLDAHPVGESSRHGVREKGEWAGGAAEGEDGSLIAILAVPAWMRPADFLEFIGGWGTCLEGVRMIREATTPNRSIVLLKFRDPLQASDFLVLFTGRAFSTLDTRETCHPIRIHHLILHRIDAPSPSTSPRTTSSPLQPKSPIAIPAFPPSVYASRAKTLSDLLAGVPSGGKYELPSCPVCLERLDSTVTGLVTLPCAHTFDCDCLRKWGDSRCPVCRVSHLLLSSTSQQSTAADAGRSGLGEREEILRLTKCASCDSTTNNWICVVCGVVGCGRYDPGKGHARRHWEESGHVLAMELDTQRVWDYKGDNYVHRLIQTRTDGKLVELPSASSLVTPLPRPLPLSGRNPHPTLSSSPARSANQRAHMSRGIEAPRQPLEPNSDGNDSSNETFDSSNGDYSQQYLEAAGPSTNDVEKMSTIEAITLEYSYLLSSQLEAMRQHYEKEQQDILLRLSELEAAIQRAQAAEQLKKDAEAAKDKAEKKAARATELSRALQSNLAAEKSMTEGLSARIKKMSEQVDAAEKGRKEKEEEVRGLEETVRDLMFSLEAGLKIQESGGAEAGEGGDLVVLPSRASEAGTHKGEKGRRKGRG